MVHKKIVILCIFFLTSLAFSNPADEANRLIDIQQKQFEQERMRQQQEKIQKELENTKFDNSQTETDNIIENIDSNS